MYCHASRDRGTGLLPGGDHSTVTAGLVPDGLLRSSRRRGRLCDTILHAGSWPPNSVEIEAGGVQTIHTMITGQQLEKRGRRSQRLGGRPLLWKSSTPTTTTSTPWPKPNGWVFLSRDTAYPGYQRSRHRATRLSTRARRHRHHYDQPLRGDLRHHRDGRGLEPSPIVPLLLWQVVRPPGETPTSPSLPITRIAACSASTAPDLTTTEAQLIPPRHTTRRTP